MEALHEVYFGRSIVEPLQNQISIIRKKLKNKPVTSGTATDKDILKFNSMVESIFGFNSFSLYIYPDPLPNAYAIPVGYLLTDAEKKQIINSLIVDKDHFKFDKKMGANINLIISIHTGLLDLDDVSDEEIMAALLHEIGHGFFEAVTDKNYDYTVAKKIVRILSIIKGYALDKVKHGKYAVDKIVDKELSHLSGFINSIKSKIDLGKSKIIKESMNDNMRRNRISYTNEKFADTFSAMFGYATECHSVDVKIMQYITREFYGVRKYPKIVEIIKTYDLYVADLLNYALGIQDEHPAELARMKTAVDYLRKELSKEGLDPKVKRELITELDNLNNLIQEYINFPKDEDSMRILRLYHIKLYEKFGGDRREQDTDNDALFNTVDDRYNSLKNGDK